MPGMILKQSAANAKQEAQTKRIMKQHALPTGTTTIIVDEPCFLAKLPLKIKAVIRVMGNQTALKRSQVCLKEFNMNVG